MSASRLTFGSALQIMQCSSLSGDFPLPKPWTDMYTGFNSPSPSNLVPRGCIPFGQHQGCVNARGLWERDCSPSRSPSRRSLSPPARARVAPCESGSEYPDPFQPRAQRSHAATHEIYWRNFGSDPSRLKI